MTLVQRIRVEDASGAQFEMYELVERRGLFVRNRRFQLDTGEAAEMVDDNSFAITRTGERFVRVQAPEMPDQ